MKLITIIFLSLVQKFETKIIENVDTPFVSLGTGKIFGVVVETLNKVRYNSYRGIPYAQPPIGERRFKEPEAYRTEMYGFANYKTYELGCIALDHYTWVSLENGKKRYSVSGSEDCLYLNIHGRVIKPTERNPVMVFIHGGGFSFGNPSNYEPDYLMERPEPVLVVTVAYRLGPMGFFSTGDGAVTGNNGLKDIVVALQWIQDHIPKFGGDPQKVSISGVDAGAAIVHFMYFGKDTHGLFRSGISYSGTAISPWALMKRATMRERSFALAKANFCYMENSSEMVQCMKAVDAHSLVANSRALKKFFYNPFALFVPVDDSGFSGAFFRKHPMEMMQTRRMLRLPWMTSFTQNNGLYPLAEIFGFSNRTNELKARWREVLPSILFYNASCRDTPVALQTDFKIPLTERHYTATLQYVTDRNFVRPALIAARLMSEGIEGSVYVSQFNYSRSESNAKFIAEKSPPGSRGASNGDDVSYVFKTKGLNSIQNHNDQDISHMLSYMAISFASNGTPPPSAKWLPYTKKDPKIMKINSHDYKQLKMVNYVRDEAVSIFDYLFDDADRQHCIF